MSSDLLSKLLERAMRGKGDWQSEFYEAMQKATNTGVTGNPADNFNGDSLGLDNLCALGPLKDNYEDLFYYLSLELGVDTLTKGQQQLAMQLAIQSGGDLEKIRANFTNLVDRGYGEEVQPGVEQDDFSEEEQ